MQPNSQRPDIQFRNIETDDTGSEFTYGVELPPLQALSRQSEADQVDPYVSLVFAFTIMLAGTIVVYGISRYYAGIVRTESDKK